jgi:hypothetical protein
MKYILISLTVAAITLFTLACKHPKYAADKLSVNQIRWGTGGGFVGKESAHILCDNGQLFNRDIMGVTAAAGKTKAARAKALFKTISALELAKMDINQPGNTYSFLEYQEGDIVSRVVWGDKNMPVEKSIQALFGELNGLLKK